MKSGIILLSLVLMSVNVSAAAVFSFKGKVRGISVASGGFSNMTLATIEVPLDIGVTRKQKYSICQDVTEREYSALLALLIDSRSRDKEASFTARAITGIPDMFCIISMISP